MRFGLNFIDAATCQNYSKPEHDENCYKKALAELVYCVMSSNFAVKHRTWLNVANDTLLLSMFSHRTSGYLNLYIPEFSVILFPTVKSLGCHKGFVFQKNAAFRNDRVA